MIAESTPPLSGYVDLKAYMSSLPRCMSTVVIETFIEPGVDIRRQDQTGSSCTRNDSQRSNVSG